MQAIIAKLKEASPVTIVKFDDSANAAVRANNEDIKSRAEDAPAEGGNIDKLAAQVGGARDAKAREASFYNYKGASAEEFVALLLARDFDKKAEADKKKAEGTEEPEPAGSQAVLDDGMNDYESPLLDPHMKSVGISNQGHPKVTNSLQIIYLYAIVNQMM